MKLAPVTRLAATLSADIGLLALTRPNLGQFVRELSAPHEAVRRDGADTVAAHVATGALCGVLCWLALGLTAALLAYVPGALGAWARRTSCLVLPATMRRFVAGAAGLGVFVAPVSALAGTAAAAPLPSPLVPISAPSSGGQLPAPVIPAVRPPVSTGSPPTAVIVRPGDSLWRIAARSLGDTATPAAIAATWPSWYAANRAVIGGDAALLSPGQVLRPPEATS